jgi:hypothetical protein
MISYSPYIQNPRISFCCPNNVLLHTCTYVHYRSQGCLNMGMQLSRQQGKGDFPTYGVEERKEPVKRNAQPPPSPSTPPPPQSPSQSPSNTTTISTSGYIYRGLYLGPSEVLMAAHTYMCVAIRCSRVDVPMDVEVKRTGTYSTSHTYIFCYASSLHHFFLILFHSSSFLPIFSFCVWLETFFTTQTRVLFSRAAEVMSLTSSLQLKNRTI